MEHWAKMVRYHTRMDANIPHGSVLFIGDSTIQGLVVAAVACPSVNYGIGGDTTRGVLARVKHYDSISRASCVVLSVGLNDLKVMDTPEIVSSMREILSEMCGVPVVLCAIQPVGRGAQQDNETISCVNRELSGLVSGNVFFLDATSALADRDGYLRDEYSDADNVHLNEIGYAMWIAILRSVVDGVRR